MCKILIFAGTTEGRQLAEYCAEKGIPAAVSAATEYGASLLPDSLQLHCGRMDADQIADYLIGNEIRLTVDATHPFAADATRNIRSACTITQTPYYRLLRDTVPIFGERTDQLSEIIERMNRTEEVILSTLGSKEAAAFTSIRHFRERIWLRILPSESAQAECEKLGYPHNHIICGKGPFTVEQNLHHIRQSNAKILLTKESGINGGYPEKAEAVREAKIRMITLCRPPETGYTLQEIITIIHKKGNTAAYENLPDRDRNKRDQFADS